MNNKLSKDRVVTTYSGKTAKRSECKRIKSEFYLIGDPTIYNSGECFLVEGKYHRFNNGKIEFDFETKNYVLIHKHHLKHGIVSGENETPLLGYYTPNLTKNVILASVSEKLEVNSCISEEVAIKLGYRERFEDGKFYLKTEKNANFFKKINGTPISKNNLPYDSRFASNITTVNYDTHFKPEFNNVNLNILGDFLESNGITFGIEFETTSGFIPQRLCYKYGLIPLRDGSISGLEYVTIPYSGRKGLYALREVCFELSKRTKFDLTCALHLHLGGLNRNVTSVLSSYVLGVLTQNQLFNMQPAYKRGGMGVKNKDYCGEISDRMYNTMPDSVNNSNVTNEFSKLFNFISDGREFAEYNNDLARVLSHPSDPQGTRKWQIQSRYKWLNFVPIVFGNKQTLEFRQHSGTVDFEKVINFLFTCASFIKITKDCSSELLNKNSDLIKNLKQSPDNSLAVLNNKLLEMGLSQLKPIIDRNLLYNKIRLDIMSDMKAKEDYQGISEKRYNGKYTEGLTSGFWE